MSTLIHQFLVCCTCPYHRVDRQSILMVKSDRDATAKNMLNSLFPQECPPYNTVLQYSTAQHTTKHSQVNISEIHKNVFDVLKYIIETSAL